MVARAVPAGRWLAPLAVLVPILAIPTIWFYDLAADTTYAALVILGGLAALAVGGHFTYGLRITLVAAIVSWSAGFIALWLWFGITIDTSLCGKSTDAAWTWLPPTAAALAFLVVGSWALRSYRIAWRLPLAVAAGFALLLLEAVVPGTQGICET